VDPQSPKPAEGSTQRSQLFTLPWIYSPHPRREKLVRLESNNFKSPSNQLLHKYLFLRSGKNDHATEQSLTIKVHNNKYTAIVKSQTVFKQTKQFSQVLLFDV